MSSIAIPNIRTLMWRLLFGCTLFPRQAKPPKCSVNLADLPHQDQLKIKNWSKHNRPPIFCCTVPSYTNMAPTFKTTKVFSLEGKALKLDTAADVEQHIKALREMDDVEEIRLQGNTLGIEACKVLGEVLETKKTLQVCSTPEIATTRILSCNSH